MEAAAALAAGWTEEDQPVRYYYYASSPTSPDGYPDSSSVPAAPQFPPPPRSQGAAGSEAVLQERSPWEHVLEGFHSPPDDQPPVSAASGAPLLHTQQMAVEMPPMRMPIMAAIGPVPSGRVELLSANLGPAAAATSMRGPSEAFQKWLTDLEQRHEERLLQEAQRRFCLSGPYASLANFKTWLCAASHHADEATVREMRRAQLCAWLLCLRARGRTCTMPPEVKDRIDAFVGGKHVWGPINAARAKAIAECAQRQLKRSEGLLRQSALAALVARYVHPAVVQAAEAGCVACYTEIPTDDSALQALFEVVASEPQQTKEVGAMLCAHLAIDGFQVEPKYHDPEYGLWRGFWVDKCNRLRLVLRW
ncbi:unnamed protein product [Effrenium voratum]|uniref:Uncharacterized protein n=1 Tax=Effrenium voratum TaxID=2562239 RepID=A0AA36NKW3_9DINO|nr:unnamed protein product [Effrenium voratum]